MNDEDIDLSEVGELGDEFFRKARLRLPQPKQQISIRLDQDVLAYFKSLGHNYQTKINAVLRKFVEDHKAA
jgi:uncharacterized protein (DUF4415 family)